MSMSMQPDPGGCRIFERLAAVLLAALAFPAGAQEGAPVDCLLEAAVARYLTDAQERILDHWELPPDSMANREVVVRLVFEADGWLRDTRVLSYTNRRLARSASVAIVRATPFAPVPSEASCLIGRPIRTTLRNPAD